MWKCDNCDWRGVEPVIATGESGGYTVDIIDVLCPSCNAQPTFDGDKAAENQWWDHWEKMGDPEHRRSFAKGLTCHHQTDEVFEDDDGSYRKCDKNDHECLIERRCPNG